MPYIGNPPAERFTSFAYQDLTGGSGTSFTLDNAVGNPQEIEVFVNNVRQEPGVAYTVSGTALTMTGSIATTDDFYVVFQGKAIQTATHPSDRALTATDGTFTGDLTVDTSTLVVDAANNRVGVGTASPSAKIHLNESGSANAVQRVQAGTNGYAAQVHLYGNNVSGAAYNSVASYVNGDSTPQWEITGAEASAEDVMILHTGGTERMRLLSGGGVDISAGNLVLDNGYGIDFSATVNSSGTVTHEILDDYEIGTFTPSFVNGVDGGATYSYQLGRYTKIGRKVIVEVDLDLNSFTANGSIVKIGSLPFTSNSSAPYGGGFFTYNGGFYNSLAAWFVGNNSTTADLYRQSDGAALGGTASGMSMGGTCRATIIYTT